MPKFSIILPVRNGGRYVKECVHSILSQSHTDFNLIVLDNCSADGTSEWLTSLDDQRIHIYPAARPLSIEENWGRITTVPKMEFMTLIGHDDLLDAQYLATMNQLIERHPSASLYQAHFRYIDSEGRLLRHSKPMDEVQSASEFLASFLANIIDTMGTGFMMRSADYDACGGIPPYPNLLFADFELWISLTDKSYKATATEECFAFRLHQSMTTTSDDIKFQNAFGLFMKFLVQLKSRDVLLQKAVERYALDFIRFYCKGLSHRLLRTPKNKRAGLTVNYFVRECKQYADQLVPGNSFDPYKQGNIKLAKQIDSNPLSRGLFLLFKKIYSKPVYK
jgi:glycosyltransferase involved in cell wall biosynthesis